MSNLSGYTRTGRVQLGPGSDLVEMQTADGQRHTAIVFHPEYRSHNAINAALGVVLGFLESPMVSGLTDLGGYELSESSFAYPTGQAWSVAEVIRTLSDLGEVGGVRAGVELMARGGEILVEAAETGENAGVYSHGGLTPWRVMLDTDGGVQIIGHALPQVEILTFHEHPDRVPREDAFRYCPPERMESRRENFSSDLFGLALIAFEVMTGKPVYDGLVNDIRAKAARGETSRRIHQFRDFLPEDVRQLLTTALRPDFRDRFSSGGEFLDAVNESLQNLDGAGLRDMMVRVRTHQPRARQELDPGKTSMLSKDELKKMMDDDPPSAPKSSRATFAAPPRRAAEAAPPARPAPEPAPAAEEPAPAGPRSVAGLPPSRRPPPRADADARPAEDLAPPVVDAQPSPEAPKYGPPSRAPGARPNPRASMMPPAEEARPPAPPPAAPPPAAPAAPASTSGDGPPSRPAMGVARLPPSRRPPGASPTESVPPAPPDPPARAAPARPAEPAAEDDVTPPPEPVRATAEPMVATPPEPTRSPPPPPEIPGSGTGPKGSPPSLPPEPAPGERAVPPPPSFATGDAAKDLLARVRSSGNSAAFEKPQTPPPPSMPGSAPSLLTSSGNAQSLRERVAAKAAEITGARARGEPFAEITGSRPIPPKPAAEPKPEPKPPAEPTKPWTRGEPVAADAPRGRWRTPDGVKSGLKGEPVPIKLSRGPGAAVQKRRLPGQSTLADIVGLLVGQAIPLRTTLDGRVAGWWRLGPESGPLPADTRLDALDPEQTLVFHFVESHVVVVDVEVQGADVAARLRAPVATGVPATSLLDALAGMLDLPAGDWIIALDGVALEPFHILSDRPLTDTSRLVLRRGA